MPTQDMSDLANETQMRIEEKTKNLSKFRHQDINISNSIEEAKIHYACTMNKMVFNNYVKVNPGDIIEHNLIPHQRSLIWSQSIGQERQIYRIPIEIQEILPEFHVDQD
eukprot:TRINITY_DN13757_c0_g2_i2.p1 TRINITY_DN13757_c0_g2~~TRINITY_DN13757_c0_g2_i2.p1  ORF type:complete len:109 (-),score=18.11 TRINITY_DN13757_c0_g2_i2:754-1080(-)